MGPNSMIQFNCEEKTLIADEILIEEIEVKVRWAPRRFEQDLILKSCRNRKAIVGQAWARRIAGMELKKEKVKKREALHSLSSDLAWKLLIHVASILRRKKLRRLRARGLH